jgi:YidC/Oxa1 family membrane protein insertase
LRAVDAIHSTLDLPWWLAIGACTLVVRIALTPLALHGSRQQAKMQGLRAQIAPLQQRIAQSGGKDGAAAAEMQALYAQHGVSPMQMLALPLVQLPIFMSFFLGLRRLADVFPDAHTGGAFWFVDLGARDESLWLPLASGFSALALVRLSVPGATAGMSASEAQQAEFMKKILSAVTLISVPVATTMPASVLVFWCANNGFSIAYTSALVVPPLREALGLPPQPARTTAENIEQQRNVGTLGSSAPPPDAASVGRAQMSAADTLAGLAAAMAESGKLDDAVAMQRRAVALREETLAASGDASSDQLEGSREALWRLAELQQQVGLTSEAEESIGRWEAAGGDAATAQEWLSERGVERARKD